MADRGVPFYDFRRGLQTKHAEEGKASPQDFETFQNVRVAAGGVKRRPGVFRSYLTSSDNTSIIFDGTNDYLSFGFDSRVHQFGTQFTIECLVLIEARAGSEYIYGNAGAGTPGVTIHVTAAGAVVANLWDTDATNTTLTSSATYADNAVIGIQLVRDGASLTLRVNNVSVATGTMSATLSTRAPTTAVTVAANGGTAFFDGQLDYLRGFSIARADHADYMLRWPAPQAPYVLFDYYGELDANGRCLDNSRYGIHSARVSTTGTPLATTALCIQAAPVQAIHPYLNKDGESKVLVIAGGRIHTFGVP